MGFRVRGMGVVFIVVVTLAIFVVRNCCSLVGGKGCTVLARLTGAGLLRKRGVWVSKTFGLLFCPCVFLLLLPLVFDGNC